LNRGSGIKSAYLLTLATLVLVVASVASFPGCGPQAPEEQTNLVVEDALILGTIVTIRAHAPREPDALRAEVRQVIDDMDTLGCRLSLYCEDSETARVNASAGESVEVSEEFETLLGYALEVAERSGGAFDPTVGPVVELWGFYSGDHRVPDQAEITEALRAVDYRRVELENGRVRIESDMLLDLEALIKGYIADYALERLRERDVTGALVIAGPSSIGALGEAPGGRHWWIGLEHPRDPGTTYAAVELPDGEHISTSGDYQRYFIDQEGIRRSHILDARTGWPAEEIMAATVLSDSSLGADGISTAVMPMQPDDALRLIDGWQGVEGLIIDAQRDIHATDRMDERVEMTRDGL